MAPTDEALLQRIATYPERRRATRERRTQSCVGCFKNDYELGRSQRKCGKCQSAFYCSKECQTRDWPAHKERCGGDDEAKLFEKLIKRLVLQPIFVVSKANELFAANFDHYTHPSIDGFIPRTLSVSLPSELVGHVDVLHPTTAFIPRNAHLVPSIIRQSQPAASCNTSDPAGVMNPTCLQDLYGTPSTPATEISNTLLVTGYLGQHAEEADLAVTSFCPDIPPFATFTPLTLGNGTNPQGPLDAGVEADLDIEYTIGIATNVSLDFLSVAESDLGTALLDTTTYLDGISNPPSVVTTSYGNNEDDFRASVATKICNGYMALGAQGISVIFASGDDGVRSGHDNITQCTNATFIPVFPASCPFVASVRATQGFAPEKAMNSSSGGFSNFFPTAYYQTAAVSAFLEILPDGFLRIFIATDPDILTDVVLVGETSASAPTFASIISRTNDRLIAAQKPLLGFLNPFLYSTAASAFTDITTGDNSGLRCPAASVSLRRKSYGCVFTFMSRWLLMQRWDWIPSGTPNVVELLAAAMERWT
ncbi:peptidase S8/S53 domain-containing protein [Mycena sanguinolenta]|nr:peptidase S8/S53 domain-containing protein [Mycena sanguinolenta]